MAYKSMEVMRIPAFTPEDPKYWFSILESKFAGQGIKKQAAKYNQVIPHLDENTTRLVFDLIVKKPSTSQYNTLKQEIIKRLSRQQEQKLESLIGDVKLGARKPSQFLQFLRSKGGSAATDERLRKIWLSKLPTVTQAILTSQTDLSLDKVAELADSISQNIVTNESIAATLAKLSSELQNMAMSTMEGIAEIKEEIHEWRCANEPIPIIALESSSHNSSSSYSYSRICWYHMKFGSDAHHCVPPCFFSS